MPVTAAVAVPHPPLIIPEVGRGEERTIQKTIDSYNASMAFLAAQKPETVVVLSPHSTLYHDYFHISPGKGASGSFARFGAPQVRIEATYDTALATALENEAETVGIPAGTEGEREPELDHATLIPLWFLNRHYTGYKVVRVGLSGFHAASHYALGQCVARAAGEKNIAVIASGDLSHRLKEDGPYGFRPEGPKLDEQITASLKTGNFASLLSIDEHLADQGAECGLRAFWIMAGALDGRAVEADLLSYEGPFGVGYVVATFLPGGLDQNRRFGP